MKHAESGGRPVMRGGTLIRQDGTSVSILEYLAERYACQHCGKPNGH